MLCVVAPVLHPLFVALDEVRVTDPPWQNVVGPFTEMTGTAGELSTVTVKGIDVDVHPFIFETVTE